MDTAKAATAIGTPIRTYSHNNATIRHSKGYTHRMLVVVYGTTVSCWDNVQHKLRGFVQCDDDRCRVHKGVTGLHE